MTETLELTQRLIACPSLTPDDAGCQDIIANFLQPLGFHCERLRFGKVDNLWARHGSTAPLVVFLGHSDVVPPGPLSEWTSPPFSPTIRDGYLYGRGACDMKSGLATMLTAAKTFLQEQPGFTGSIAFLVTSDEEGPSIDGTVKVIEHLQARGEKIDYCIVGEASSEKQIGDQIRIGRRGSLSGKLIIQGKQGHIAYPHLTVNPIHQCLPALHELASTAWDQGNEFFPPTSFQMSNIHAGTGANNVVPGSLEVLFNFRYSTASTVDNLKERVLKILNQYPFKFTVTWSISGGAFLTPRGKLISAAQHAIRDCTGSEPVLSTGGGTSDGRFVAPTGAEVIEIGPCNASAHQINEHVCIEDLEKLRTIYQRLLHYLFT